MQIFIIKSNKNSKISNNIEIEIPKNKDKAPPKALMNDDDVNCKKKVFLKCFCSDGRGIPIFGWKCTRSDTQ